MENSNSISAFDILRQRLKMPDPWTLTGPPAVSKRQIPWGRINRIFGHMLVLLGLRSFTTAAKSYPCVGQGLKYDRMIQRLFRNEMPTFPPTTSSIRPTFPTTFPSTLSDNLATQQSPT